MTNSEKVNPEIEIEILGEKKKLKFTLNTYCLLEEATGIDVMAGDAFRKLDARTVSALVWAALKAADQTKLTLEQFRDEVKVKDLALFRLMVMQSVKDSMPPEKKTDDEKPTTEQSSSQPSEPIGSDSGQSVDTTSDSQSVSTAG